MSGLSASCAPDEIIDDLCMRFMDSIPEEHRNDDIRVFFEIEMAHWFYMDNYCEHLNFPQCKPVKFRNFCHQVYDRCKYLKSRKRNCDKYIEEFSHYKQTIDTNGAILIDRSLEYVLLVRGYQNSASWGFPKGKVNEAESPVLCAIREVEEEVGYDISDSVKENISLSRFVNKAVTQLFVVTDVPLDAKFKPNVNKEIGKIQWFRLDCLPRDKNDEECFRKIGLRASKFYNVSIFVSEIQRYIQKLKAKRSKKEKIKSPKKPITETNFTGESFLQMFKKIETHAASLPNMETFAEPCDKSDRPYTICVFVDEKTKSFPSASSTPNIHTATESPRQSSLLLTPTPDNYLRNAASASTSLFVLNSQADLQCKTSDISENFHLDTLSEQEQVLKQATDAMRRFFKIKSKSIAFEAKSSSSTSTALPSNSVFYELFPNLSNESSANSTTQTPSRNERQNSRSPLKHSIFF